MRLLLLAPPGAGKGTQGERLSQHFGIEHISTGDLLRKEIAKGTKIGESVREFLERGDLVPDDVMIEMIREHVVVASARGGYVLDGFPRNIRQAEQARKTAVELGVSIQAAIYLDVSRDELIRRLLGRSSREGRADDNEQVILHRLDVFERETVPLAGFYDQLGLLVRIDGEQPVDQVTEAILEGVASVAH